MAILKESIITELTKFPCPICHILYKPYLSKVDGVALMECKEHGLYQTNVESSKMFRLLCSKVAKGRTKTTGYYTKSESKIKRILDELEFEEGFDYMHNVRFKGLNTYYYTDFYLPHLRLVIEVSPSIWHNMNGRNRVEESKLKYLSNRNLRVLILDDECLRLKNGNLVKFISDRIDEVTSNV
jgi:hypothetical protein